MRHEHTPRPDVEHHYHIKELIEAQDRNAQDRNYHRQRLKDKEERDQIIKDSPGKDTRPFYCSTCDEEFAAESIKEIEVDWSNTAQNVAFYRSKCFKGHWCMRLVTDKHKDIYFFKAKSVARDRGKHFRDTVQPWETGYELLYSTKRK